MLYIPYIIRLGPLSSWGHTQDLPGSGLLCKTTLRLVVSGVPSGTGSPESSSFSEGEDGVGGMFMGSTFASLNWRERKKETQKDLLGRKALKMAVNITGEKNISVKCWMNPERRKPSPAYYIPGQSLNLPGPGKVHARSNLILLSLQWDSANLWAQRPHFCTPVSQASTERVLNESLLDEGTNEWTNEWSRLHSVNAV